MAASIGGPPPKRGGFGPLSVIMAFISLSQVVLTVGLLNTTGHIQEVLLWFFVSFPTSIFVLFYLALWFRPVILYGPTEFGDSTIEQFAAATGSPRRADTSAILNQIAEIVDSKMSRLAEAAASRPNDPIAAQISESLEEAKTEVLEGIQKEATIEIDFSPYVGHAFAKSLFAGDGVTVDKFTDDIWWTITSETDAKIPPFTYGKKWIIEDAESGKRFKEIGASYRNDLDRRPLAEVGIRPGMKLRILRVRGILG